MTFGALNMKKSKKIRLSRKLITKNAHLYSILIVAEKIETSRRLVFYIIPP
jgi:hypothetical protein